MSIDNMTIWVLQSPGVLAKRTSVWIGLVLSKKIEKTIERRKFRGSCKLHYSKPRDPPFHIARTSYGSGMGNVWGWLPGSRRLEVTKTMHQGSPLGKGIEVVLRIRNRKVAPIWDNSRVNPFVQDDSLRNFGMEKDLSLLGYGMSTRVYHSSTSAGACSKPFGQLWGLSSPQLIKTSRTSNPIESPRHSGMFETGYILELSPWLGDQASNLRLPNFQ